jgi:hypothetical protein
MIGSQRIPPIRFHSSFFDEDWPSLSDSVQEALRKFLIRLQEDPYSSDIAANAQMDNAGRFAYRFAPGYVVYWRVVTKTEDQSLMTNSSPERIEVLAISKS